MKDKIREIIRKKLDEVETTNELFDLFNIANYEARSCDCKLSRSCRYELIMRDKQHECSYKIAN